MVAGYLQVDDPGQRPECEPVAMEDGVAAHTFAIDEGAGGGIGIKQLDAAVSISHQFGMVFRDTTVIDDDIVVLSTPECDVISQRYHDFLAVFEYKSDFCHGCA